MEDPVDISYYLGKQVAENAGSLDVTLSNGEIVSINLIDELPEDPNELINFLETENCPRKYWIAIAIAYAQSKKLNESLEVIKKAISLSQFNKDDKLSFHSFLGWLYLKFVSQGVDKEENLAKASKEINQLLTVGSTNNTSSLLSKAVLYLFIDQADQALEIFDKLLKIDQSNCFALLGKAQIILNKTKNYSNALKLYQQVLILNPLMKPDPRIGIGFCFWFLKDEKMAISSWERSLELDPNNLKAKILLNLADFNNSFNNSLSDEEFSQNYKTCLEGLSKNYTYSPNDSVILLALSSYYFSKENYDLVEKIVNKVIFNITGSSNLIKFNNFVKLSKYQYSILSQCSLWLGRISFASSDFMQAQKHFHESIKLNENNLLAKLGLGQSQINRGSIEEAIITYESILKTNPKCLEVNYSLGVLYSQQKSKKKQEQAIQILERYLRLSNNRGLSSSKNDEGLELLNKEPVALNAYSILSKLYETRDINQSLNYLKKAVESRKQVDQDVPLEVYNNIGVFNFIKKNYEISAEYFQIALNKLNETKEIKDEADKILVDLPEDLRISLTFNLARSQEISKESESIEMYETLLNECTHYFSAKLRLLFLDCVSTNRSTKEDIKQEIEALLNLNASDLEIRSFYGWFVKNFGKKLGLKPDADTNHQKDTLVEYDSHDCYALISLANIYCIMARDIKASNQDEKKKKYYIRAIELYSKVLSIDPKNVYAAQGLAIVYIENKELNKGLDILRKIRDSLNDISVYLNLGHVLVDLKQYTKAIENYEIALARYTDGKDSRILSFLGRAWYLRGLFEKNLFYLKKSLEYSEEALDNFSGAKSSLKFNLAYIQFQIAEFITKLPIEQRNVEDIKEAIINLNSAIEILNSLASDDEKHPPYPKAELKARANLGTSTLLNRLNSCLEETKENISKIESRLEEAKRLREEEVSKRMKEEEEKLAAKRLKEEELVKERAKLQEQAQQWAEEARMNVIDDEGDDRLVNEESAANDEKKKKGRRSATPKGKSKNPRTKKVIVDDSEEEESSTSESELETENDLKRKKDILDDDENENEIKSKKKRKTYLSKEIIEDSDEDLDDDLFNDNGGLNEGDKINGSSTEREESNENE